MSAPKATESPKLQPQFQRAALALILVACTVFLGVGAWREWALRDAELRSAETDISNLSRSLIRQMDDTVELADIVLSGLALRLEVNGMSPAALETLREFVTLRKRSVTRLRALFVYDAAGNWLLTSENVDIGRYNNADREYFQHHRADPSDKAHIGRPIRSRSGGQWILPISKRFNHADGTFAGVVLATIDISYFSSFFQTFDLGRQGVISLISTDRVLLARWPLDESTLGRPLAPTNLPGSQSTDLFRLETVASPIDGVERVNALRRSETNPFHIVVAMSRNEILQQWRTGAVERMGLSAILTLVVGAMAVLLVRRLAERQNMLAALAATETEFRLLAEGASDMVTRIDFAGMIAYASPSTAEVVGLPPDAIVGSQALATIHPADRPAVEILVAALRRGEQADAKTIYRTRHSQRGEIWVESSLRVTRSPGTGAIDGVIAVTRDITVHKLRSDRLADLAGRDGLTAIANRRTFDQTLAVEWHRCQREQLPLSLLMIDVDHFKLFNDTYGHQSGDDCLRKVATALAEISRRPADLVARYGGEEFVILLPGTDPAGARDVAERARTAIVALGLPHGTSPVSTSVTVSIGSATEWPRVIDRNGPADLIAAADRALYAAKSEGRDRIVVAPQTRDMELNRKSA